MILDDVFLKQSEIAVDVKTQLKASMQPFGHGISKVLITDLIPDDRVKASMNSINAALRDQEAAKAEGEAKRILMVAQAEAEKQAKIRQGEVIAGEREAVAKGLQKSILEIKDAVPGVSESDVLAILALTRHYGHAAGVRSFRSQQHDSCAAHSRRSGCPDEPIAKHVCGRVSHGAGVRTDQVSTIQLPDGQVSVRARVGPHTPCPRGSLGLVSCFYR